MNRKQVEHYMLIIIKENKFRGGGNDKKGITPIMKMINFDATIKNHSKEISFENSRRIKV